MQRYISFVFFIAIFCLICRPTVGSVGLIPQPPFSHHCLDDNFNPRAVGEKWYDYNKCERRHCFRSGGQLFTEIAGCGAVHYAGCASVMGNRLLPYPGCCPQPLC